MNESVKKSVHWSFWLIASLALIWNLMGLMNYLMQMSPEGIAAMPESHRALIDGRPAWATAGFASSVFCGALGGLLLLLRKPLALYFFVLSLLAVLITMAHAFMVLSDNYVFSIGETILAVIMPMLVAVFLVWYARRAQRYCWLG